MGFNEFMTKLFGNKSQRDLKEITPYVDKVKAVYPSIKALSNDELRAKTDEIKQRIQDYVAEEKAQVEELRKGIEDKELEEREAIWAEVDKIESHHGQDGSGTGAILARGIRHHERYGPPFRRE